MPFFTPLFHNFNLTQSYIFILMKSRTTAAVLAICLGGIGIHRFYLDQPLLGVLYLLFCWTFIPLLVSIVDFIWLLTMDDRTFDMNFNSQNAPRYPYIQTNPISPSTTQNNQNVTINSTPQNSRVENVSDEILKLYELKEKGIITQDEFESRKKILLK